MIELGTNSGGVVHTYNYKKNILPLQLLLKQINDVNIYGISNYVSSFYLNELVVGMVWRNLVKNSVQ